MSGSLSATRVDLRGTHERIRRHAAARFKFTGMTIVATIILTVALLSAQSKPVRAGGRLQVSASAQPPDPTGQSGFAAEIRWTLKKQHDQMINLANQLIARPDGLAKLNDQSLNQQIAVQKAMGDFKNAQLTREVAEIAIVEYEEGVFRQDRATVEGELKLAESDLTRARSSIEFAKGQLAKIKQASKGTASDLANEFAFADNVLVAERGLPKSELAFRKVESKLKILVEHIKPKIIKGLKSEVEKARSAELAKRAAWELDQSKLKQLREAIKAREVPAREREAQDLLHRQALAALDRAISVDEQVRTKLEQFIKNGKPDDPLRKEIQDLTNQLQALIDQAEAAQSAARFLEWKPRIHAAAN